MSDLEEIQEIVEVFTKERLKQGMSSRAITGNEGKGVYRMEGGTSIPKLTTFKRWCDKIGLKIKLVKK